MSTSFLKNIIIILVLLGVPGYFGYTMFIRSPSPSFTTIVEPTNGMTGEQILALINKLKSLSADQAIFSSEAFIRLRDFSTTLVPEQQGRPNPFMPIGVETSQTTPVRATSTRVR